MLNQAFNAINLQKRALDASWLRQSVLSENIANINTPGYKRKDVVFDTMLEDFLSGSRASLVTTNPKHMGGAVIGEPTVSVEDRTNLRLDGNNVNIDTEMAEIAQNSIKYNAMTTDVNNQIRRLKAAIRVGR